MPTAPFSPAMMIPDVLILGAGLAGLHAARTLHAAGHTVRVLDKSHGLGGRAATRRWDGVPADHGAQFFTARSPEFRARVADWETREVCFPWATGFHRWEDGTLRPPEDADAAHPRYACRAGMTALSKDLAAGLPDNTVGFGRRAVALHATAEGWSVDLEASGGEPHAGRALLLAMPVPQALVLLETAGLPGSALAPLRAVDIGPTLAVLRRLPADAGPATLPWKGIQARDQAETVTWIGADFDKRPGPAPAEAVPRIFSLHGGPEFSRANVDGDLAEAGRRIVERGAEMVGPWLADPRGETQVHRWRYAAVTRGFDPDGAADCYEVPGTPAPLLVAGDAFCGAKVEGAWRSGGAAARRLLLART